MKACLTMEYRDAICEHCLQTTQKDAEYYDDFHMVAVGRGSAWAIWCEQPCGPECPHEGQESPMVRQPAKVTGRKA